MSIRVPDHVKRTMAANFLDTFAGNEEPIPAQDRLFESALWSTMRDNVDCIPTAIKVYDCYAYSRDRIQSVYSEYGMSKRFVDACTWLWVFFDGPEEYLKRNGHLPVNMWYFAYLAFNNEWDDLEPLLNMEI